MRRLLLMKRCKAAPVSGRLGDEADAPTCCLMPITIFRNRCPQAGIWSYSAALGYILDYKGSS